ncbi:hypothetical protein Pfo_024811 [Paulownia fortunei]|nr:hypothetical protein Pfo_024811 [Paulownia fortunei]
MEGGESLLDTLFDEESVEDAQDVEMLDVEEGELIEQISKTEVGESFDVGGNQVNQESHRRNSRHKKKKKKNKRKGGSSTGPNVTNINRFVLDACKRLRERKSYLMWTAVGCLGVSALSDLVKEVDAIQACGGQKTADGSRFRNGGGILWNIIKVRDPNAYKEIMTKGKEFEKQFKQQLHDKQEPKQQTEASSQSISLDANQVKCNPSDGLELTSHGQSQLELSTAGQKRASVHDRIRLPVTYDDLLGGEDPKDELA